MRICLELTSSGSQLALHRTLSKGLTAFCGERRQSSPRRAAAPSQSPRGGPRGPTRTMRRASVASPVARFPSTRPARDTPTSITRRVLRKVGLAH